MPLNVTVNVAVAVAAPDNVPEVCVNVPLILSVIAKALLLIVPGFCIKFVVLMVVVPVPFIVPPVWVKPPLKPSVPPATSKVPPLMVVKPATARVGEVPN